MTITDMWVVVAAFSSAAFGIGALVGMRLGEPKKGLLRVGDKVPSETLAGWQERQKPLGAFIKVCPECTRIDSITFQ